MTKFTKIAAAAVAALTLTAGVLSTTNQAQAFPKKGFPIGLGLGLGLATTAIIANAAYADRCIVPVYDAWGNYVGRRNVCY